MGKLPNDACGLRLCKIVGDDLRLCEAVKFTRGRAAVDTVLRRAAISGDVEIEPSGELLDFFADVLDENGDMVGNVALDRRSFNALKNHWMRCKYEVRSTPNAQG